MDAQDKDGVFLGLENLKGIIPDHPGGSAQGLCDGVGEEVIGFQGESQFDDVTLMGVRSL